MAIDFHANYNWVIIPQNNQAYIETRQPALFKALEDSFVRNINIQNPNVNNLFKGIIITKKNFGTIEKSGKTAELYTITNKNGASIDLSSFGAAIVSIKVPDKNGRLIDVTQGYDSVTPYEKSPIGHAGGTIGPCANKINNGIFTIGDKEYKLKCNKDNGLTHSHGADAAFDIQNWKPEILKEGIKFTYTKKDMDGGYPANVKTSVIYKFDNNNNLTINYQAETDGDTILNLTNHSYFNLNGADSSEENSVMEHFVEFPNSTKYTPVNKIAIPTGELNDVKNSKFDFLTPKKISEMNIEGYDQNFVIDGYDGKKLITAAKIKSHKSGITLNVSTDLPGFQFYTANNLGNSSQPAGKGGKKYEKRSALCIEPQFFPDAINSFEEKPILKKGQKYNRTIRYSFGVEN